MDGEDYGKDEWLAKTTEMMMLKMDGQPRLWMEKITGEVKEPGGEKARGKMANGQKKP